MTDQEAAFGDASERPCRGAADKAGAKNPIERDYQPGFRAAPARRWALILSVVAVPAMLVVAGWALAVDRHRSGRPSEASIDPIPTSQQALLGAHNPPGPPRLSPSLAASAEPTVAVADSTRAQSLVTLNAKVNEIEDQIRRESDPTRRKKLQAFAEAIEQLRQTVR